MRALFFLGTLLAFLFQASFAQNPAKDSNAKTPIKTKEIQIQFDDVKTIVTLKVQSERYDVSDWEAKTKGSVIKNFKPPESIDVEMKSENWSIAKIKEERKQILDFYKKEKLPKPSWLDVNAYSTLHFPWGKVYRWNTPTRGSRQFDYVCLKEQTYCLKFGPYNPTGGELDWSSAKFETID